MGAQQCLPLSIITISSINNKLYIGNHRYYLSFNKLVYRMIKDTSMTQHQDAHSSYSSLSSISSLQSELGLLAFLEELKTATSLVQTMKSSLDEKQEQDLPEKVLQNQEKQRSDKTWLLERYSTLAKKFQSLVAWVQKRQSDGERKNRKVEKRLSTLGKRAWEFQGDKLFLEGKYKQVIELSQDILKAVPQLSEQFEGLGNIEDRTGVIQNDITSWYKEHWQSHSNAYDLLCLSHSLLQSYEEAEKWYSYRLGKDKDNYKLIFGLANILYNTGRFDKAEQTYKKVISLNPDFEKSYRMIAFIKIVKQNKKEDGKAWAILSKQKRRNNIFADYLLALCEENPTDQILKLQGLLQEMQTPYPRLYNAIGSAYLEKKEHDESIKFFKKSIEASPHFQIPYYNLGLAYQEKQQLDEAILQFQQCLSHNPKYNNALIGLGNIYSKKGDKDKSVQYYQKCLQVTPNHLGALSGLGRVLALHNDYEQAAKHFNRCLQLNADHLISLNSLGNIHFFKGQFDEAISFYKRSVELNPQYTNPYNGLCRAFGKKGDQAQARKWLQKKESIKPQ